MGLTILTDANVRDLLGGLTIREVEEMQQSLRQALHEYSTGTQETASCADNQPMRTSMQSAGNRTTLFMPSSGSAGLGLKVVTLAAPSADASSTDDIGDTRPHGSLQIMSPTGEPTGFLNAEELTGFRTALCSTLLLRRRSQVKTITVFGTGKQAFWHLRLALLLRGDAVKHIHIINRSFSDRAKLFLHYFYTVPKEQKEAEGWAGAKFSMLTPGYGEFNRLIKEQVRSADVIYCTVPSTEPLFDHSILTSHDGRKKGRLIVAIGSYKAHMIELPTELVVQATRTGHAHHHHKHAVEGGAIVVDSLTACLKEAGEVIQAGLTPQQLVEIGELVMLEEKTALAQAAASDHSDSGSSTLSLSTLSLSASTTEETSGRDSPPRATPSTPTAARPVPPVLREPSTASSASSASLSSPTISFDLSRPSIATVFGDEPPSSPTGSTLSGSTLQAPASPTSSSSSRSHRRSHSQSRLRAASPMAQRASNFLHHRRSSSMGDQALKKEKERQRRAKEDGMARWLCEGNVVYKSVGFGLVDLVVGADLVALAKKKGVGVQVEGF